MGIHFKYDLYSEVILPEFTEELRSASSKACASIVENMLPLCGTPGVIVDRKLAPKSVDLVICKVCPKEVFRKLDNPGLVIFTSTAHRAFWWLECYLIPVVKSSRDNIRVLRF